ncbi:hypothetical protein CGLO_13705 [Colletotrichum gloeosporioides Cg-14]|uniref:Uncharacterized protein n=1 Tax=Colletotrichum gloeosporioides (strain Cg-14) TaxID=1237896 RepID=T0K343_COLGC|nr:hypothetical protein CGLO_13705 [Colletotrichum gloeosporioides Cg-14]
MPEVHVLLLGPPSP